MTRHLKKVKKEKMNSKNIQEIQAFRNRKNRLREHNRLMKVHLYPRTFLLPSKTALVRQSIGLPKM